MAPSAWPCQRRWLRQSWWELWHTPWWAVGCARAWQGTGEPGRARVSVQDAAGPCRAPSCGMSQAGSRAAPSQQMQQTNKPRKQQGTAPCGKGPGWDREQGWGSRGVRRRRWRPEQLHPPTLPCGCVAKVGLQRPPLQLHGHEETNWNNRPELTPTPIRDCPQHTAPHPGAAAAGWAPLWSPRLRAGSRDTCATSAWG